MGDIALRAVGLGKMYRIGGERLPYHTIRETLVQMARRPIERIRHPGSATHFSQEFWALRDVDLSVEHGEVLGVIGRNGAGKSTLLKVLSHITEPTEGRVEIGGRVGSLLEVGTGFHPELTGRENIRLNGAILGMKRAEIRTKFDEIVEFSELSSFLDTPVKRYSSGMYVRLAFAVAAHLEPEILVVDEVLAVGDAEFQKKCIGRMGDVAKSGRTVLFVSHNMAAVQGLCTSAILLDKGRIVQRGEVGKVVAGYLQKKKEGDDPSQVLARSKDGSVELLGVRLTDSSGNVLQGIQCGDTVRFEILVQSSVERRAAAAAIGINDAYGRRVAVLHSGLYAFSSPLRIGLQAFVCQIDRMPLSPGEYRLDVHIYGGRGGLAEPSLVHAPNSISLDIVTGDYHGTGQLPPEKWGGVVQVPQRWSYMQEPVKQGRTPEAVAKQPH